MGEGREAVRSRRRKAWWLKQSSREVLLDFYSNKLVRVWLALDPNNDLSMEEVGADGIGDPPEWLQYERENLGWRDILGITWTTSTGGWSETELVWGLKNGIAPGQAFLVELPHPSYTTSHAENGTEHDVDFYPEIIRVQPMGLYKVARAWERELKDTVAFREALTKQREEQAYLARTEVKSMYLACDVYFGSNQSSWDDMAMPSGIRYSLRSRASLDKKRHAFTTLVQGEDDSGDHERAMNRLVERARAELPGLPPEVVRSLPRREW